jgi:hypothetical protein
VSILYNFNTCHLFLKIHSISFPPNSGEHQDTENGLIFQDSINRLGDCSDLNDLIYNFSKCRCIKWFQQVYDYKENVKFLWKLILEYRLYNYYLAANGSNSILI